MGDKEIEIKILDIDRAQAVRRLGELGAKKIASYNFRRLVFPISRRKGRESYIRLRTDGKTHTLTLKANAGWGKDRYEYETTVGDFKAAARIFYLAFPREVLYEETTRTEYSLDGTAVTLDKWPGIPLYAEIEGESRKQVYAVYRKLGIAGIVFGNVPAGKVYEHYGIDFRKIALVSRSRMRKLLK